MATGYTYVWEFTVDERARTEFEREYGPGGRWVALFRSAAGYLESLLLRDDAVPGRYLTVDRWQSEAAYRAFRADFAAQYAALDRDCERLTQAERALGSFTEIRR
jgi:heme-degrading monooxygenase HmoA